MGSGVSGQPSSAMRLQVAVERIAAVDYPIMNQEVSHVYPPLEVAFSETKVPTLAPSGRNRCSNSTPCRGEKTALRLGLSHSSTYWCSPSRSAISQYLRPVHSGQILWSAGPSGMVSQSIIKSHTQFSALGGRTMAGGSFWTPSITRTGIARVELAMTTPGAVTGQRIRKSAAKLTVSMMIRMSA